MTDTIDQLAGLEQGGPTFATRHEREKVALATQACEDLLLGNTLDSALSQAERLVLAAEQARVSGVSALEAEYRGRAQALAVRTLHATGQARGRGHGRRGPYLGQRPV